MKVLKSIFFCFVCLLAFLVAGAASCTIRAKYWGIPKVRASLASSYAGLFGEYSFLQYNQAGAEQGKAALLDYLGLLDRIQNERIQYPRYTLHFDAGLTYLRLYRLEMAANKPAEAGEYLRSAQKEFASSGMRGDLSSETLAKNIAVREAGEAKRYNKVEGTTVPATERKR
jgi:hypothetical protein